MEPIARVGGGPAARAFIIVGAALAIAMAPALAACGGDDGGGVCDGGRCVELDAPFEGECTPVIGDLSRPIEVVPIGAGAGGPTDIADGHPIALFAPPQGGMILLAGGRARNLDGCGSQVTASLRDPGSGMVVALESRPSQLEAGADGWGRPFGALFWTLANVSPCPNAAALRDIHDSTWQLEIRIETPDGRSGTATRLVVPTCSDDFCRCVCDADYEPGMCGRGGPFDGGV